MIKFDKVTKIYPSNTAVLKDVTFEIKEGEFVSIIGKSGAGKTTLTRLILGLEEPTYGEVYFKEKNMLVADASEIQKIRRSIGGIYQDYKLLPAKTVYENVSYVLEVKGTAQGEIKKEVEKVLDLIGLKDKKDNFPKELSGGEQQRLAIARALVIHPKIIIADEPTGNLDPYNTYEVIYLLEKINKAGATVILLTHNREIINKLGKRVITLVGGRIIRDEAEGRFII
ncbi:MAG: cell division ATP-binding protein FtsE [Candidatus Staskawiczbacteria bacterium RIFOXYC1_FULL_37_43]|nr:MAG: cell division ATP-binding protein FtsE [Candidatus Staskawiczbacteria bacterium RIFCSPHIGHO2_01_FULL_37_17]OGZ72326.1 MAG: cell division ATP-binding protein FtsE [Candidatus Staskawiczbacteria bacterium RIFCSPLOWO2_01_FULL_37_19]OGZ76090.1 MAG: cell division ATP-binding protein FtsE [Candidatus Staskawiczbacteria bacterium RIFOXYA1_FULL_37_15]OGZ77126.1 MAG: cell division ATP-binding protein FtsE [Candidatus Staskawiczbacteria bacterium RIFOXYA12_FULL_37_10]OGZ80057.1 MAG: cell division